MLGNVRSWNDELGQRDAVIWQEDDLVDVVHILVGIDDLGDCERVYASQ